MSLIENKVYQLPKTVIPLHYDVFFKPHVEKATFEGEINIRVKVHEPTNEIYLHAHKLTIKEAIFKFEVLNKTFKPEKIIYDAEHHMFRLFFGQNIQLPVGYGVLNMKYEGHIVDNDYEGVYFNRYGNGHEFWLMTCFENFKAHFAFPCWDEPWAKATWKFQFDIPKHWNVIFNTDYEKNEITGDFRRVNFYQTPILHPGSIAFMMGVFDKFEHSFTLPNGRMMQMNMFYPKFEHYGTTKFMEHAKIMKSGMFEVMEKLFFGYANYFHLFSNKFNLMDKMDFIAVPNYFTHGNGYYGMVYMNYDNFWFDKVQTDTNKMVQVASILAQHIGRHYFGHYLNFNQWNHHYLMESFVTFFKYLILDRVYPEYHVWETIFFHNELVKSIRYDQLPSTMPLDWTDKFTFFNKTFFENMFFNGSMDEHYFERFTRYGKGAVVMNMLRDYVSPMIFDNVMVEIMHKYQYRTIEPEEFWHSFEFASKKSVIPFVHSWIYKEAFPIVHITGKFASNGDYHLTLKQENVLNYYKNLPTYSKFEKYAGKWNDYMNENVYKYWSIPLKFDFGPEYSSRHSNTYSYNSITSQQHYFHHPMVSSWNDWTNKELLFDREEMTIVFPSDIMKISNGYFKVTPKTFGYVIFNYPEEHIRKHFLPVMNNNNTMINKHMQPIDNIRFMLDIFTMWKIGVYSGNLFFDTMKSYVEVMKHETYRNYSTMKMIMDSVYGFRKLCVDTGADDMMIKLQKFASFVVKDMKNYIKQEHFWTSDKDVRFSHDDEKMIGLLAHFMVVFRDADIEKYAVDYFWKWFQNGDLSKKMFVKDLHRAMFVAVAHTNESRVLEVFMKLYQEFYRFPEARNYVIYAMGYFTNKALIEKILQWIMTDQVMTEDKLHLFRSMMSRYPNTRDIAFSFFKNKYDYFGKHYNNKWLSRDLFEELTSYYSNDKKMDDILSFVDERMPVDITGKHYWLNQRFMHVGYEQCYVKHQFFVNNQKVFKEFFDRI